MIDADLGAKVVTRKSIIAVANKIGLGLVDIKKQRSCGGGTHWIVQVDRELIPLETLAIQACMGDDLKRCSLNLGRIMGGNAVGKDWNILYDAKIYARNGGLLNATKKD